MCGIAGLLSLDDAPPPRAEVARMLAALAHRGPDGEGIEECGPAVLGHRRRAILDVTPAGRQPMADASGRFVLTFNGEIYNYLELRAGLEASGARFRSRSDTEVLVEALARWGPAAVERFNGMFAFAAYDRKERTLFAARDRFGEKPFYYRLEEGRRFAFASEIHALLGPRGVGARPREEVLCSFLAFGHAGTTATTPYEGVDQLPPAHTLTLRGGRVTLRRYWSLPGAPEVQEEPEAASVARVRDLLADAVRIRLRSDVPVGSCLSGGLDSSTLVGAIASLREPGAPPQVAFSAVFPGDPVDESRWIDAVEARTGVRVHRVEPTAEGFLEDWPALQRSQEKPVGGPSIYAQWCVMRRAREEGVVVLLDGQGSDEVFGGYHFLFQDHWWSLLRSGRVGELRREMAAFDALHGAGRARPILRAGVRSRVPRWIGRMRSGASFPWIAGEFLARAYRPAPARPADLRGSLRECLGTRMIPHLLRHADRNSMAFAREVRLPFLDHRLVEAVDALPDGMKLRGGVTKWALREAARGWIPEEIRSRTDKLGFAVPTLAWLRGPLSGLLRDTLLDRTARERGILEAGALSASLDAFLAGDDGPADAVWNAFAAESWLRLCVDGKAGGA